MKRIIYTFLTLFFVLVFTECKNKHLKDEPITKETKNIIIDSLDNVLIYLPSPNEILDEILDMDFKFNHQIVNPIENSVNYIDINSQAINLGVYITDYAYLNLSEDNIKEISYLKTIKEIAESIDLFGIINENTIKRIQSNLTEKDTIDKITRDIFYQITDNLEATHREEILSLISAGVIIETIYLCLNDINDFKQDQRIINKVFEQKFLFDNFYEYFNKHSYKITKTNLINQIKTLNNSFQSIESSEVSKQKSDSSLIFSNRTEFILNDKKIIEFRKNIQSIRNNIINP